MTYTLKTAEQMVRHLIDEANHAHVDAVWDYEVTSDVDNIEVASGPGTHTLRIHPCWLRYVVSQGDFTSCVADEIDAYYLLALLTADVSPAA